MTDEQAHHLERLLTALCSLQEQLAMLGDRKTAAMVALDTPALEHCVHEEAALVGQLEELNEQKQQWAESVRASSWPPPMELAQAIQQAPASLRDRLAVLYERVREWIERVRRTSLITVKTGRHCVEHFRSMVQILTHGTLGPTVYSPQGGVPHPTGGCLVDDVA